MDESNKQEGQKTVVSFIAGLLIGGLLVWVFSDAPDSQSDRDNDDRDSMQEEMSDSDVLMDSDEIISVKKNHIIVTRQIRIHHVEPVLESPLQGPFACLKAPCRIGVNLHIFSVCLHFCG